MMPLYYKIVPVFLLRAVKAVVGWGADAMGIRGLG